MLRFWLLYRAVMLSLVSSLLMSLFFSSSNLVSAVAEVMCSPREEQSHGLLGYKSVGIRVFDVR